MKNILFLILITSVQIGLAQCTNDSHSTHANDAWLSCQTSSNPNPVYGTEHWLQYDLGAIYSLSTTTIWNYNVQGNTNQGAQTYRVDYSIDGITWTALGSVYTLNEATGLETYTGEVGPDFAGLDAQYILFTFLTNHNTANNDCMGISEVRFTVLPPACSGILVHPTLPLVENGIIDYESNATIESRALILSSGQVDYDAALSIDLNSGFEVQLGAVFHAVIDGCNDGLGGSN